MYKIIYEPIAENDLFDILFYYAEQGGMTLAESLLGNIKTQIGTLENMPYRIQDHPTLPNTKRLVIDKLPYIAYFRIDEENKKVFVFNVIHTSRNYPN